MGTTPDWDESCRISGMLATGCSVLNPGRRVRDKNVEVGDNEVGVGIQTGGLDSDPDELCNGRSSDGLRIPVKYQQII